MIVTAATIALALAAGPPSTDGSASITITVDDGGTKVENRGKSWVSATPHEGKPQELAPGGKVVFTSTTDPPLAGSTAQVPPTQTAAAQTAATQAHGLPAPALLQPQDQARLKVKPTEKGPGQVQLTWSPVSGAREYEVEFSVDNGPPKVLKAARTELTLPPLSSGKVKWAVRGVADKAGEQSAKRWFEVQPEPLKLEARGSGWR